MDTKAFVEELLKIVVVATPILLEREHTRRYIIQAHTRQRQVYEKELRILKEALTHIINLGESSLSPEVCEPLCKQAFQVAREALDELEEIEESYSELMAHGSGDGETPR